MLNERDRRRREAGLHAIRALCTEPVTDHTLALIHWIARQEVGIEQHSRTELVDLIREAVATHSIRPAVLDIISAYVLRLSLTITQ